MNKTSHDKIPPLPMVIPILPTTIMTISYAEEENRINSALEALCADTYLSCDEIITALSVLEC
jgi:hypothetical protein